MFIYSFSAQLIFLEINCFYSLRRRIYFFFIYLFPSVIIYLFPSVIFAPPPNY